MPHGRGGPVNGAPLPRPFESRGQISQMSRSDCSGVAFSSRMTAAKPRPGEAAPDVTSDPQAFELLIEMCWDALWRFAYRMTGSVDEAEDLLSESLLEGFRSFASFQGRSSFLTWMHRIMFTTRIDMQRRNRRHTAESLEAAGQWEACAATGRPLGESAEDPLERVLEPFLSEEVQRALDALPEDQRAVLILADIEQMDYRQVSRTLGLPVGTVRSRLHRARSRMRHALAPLLAG